MPDLKSDLLYAHIVSFCIEHPWAITRPMLRTIAGIVGRRAAGRDLPRAEIDGLVAQRDQVAQRRMLATQPASSMIAIIPVFGVLVPRANMMSDISGGTSFEALTGQLREAMGNPAISTILFDVDSPGGNVAGATEFAREVLRSRAKKTIVAHANFTMASAAYWFSACATEVVASPSATVGSIGVLTIHDDLSKALEMEGIKETYIAAGKYKTEGNETEPLSPEAEAFLQRQVDIAYGRFVADVAKGRGAAVAEVREGYGQGRAISSGEALELKMIDKIETIDATLTRLMSAPDKGLTALQPARGIGDPEQPADGTAQEPFPATAQDRQADIQWQHTIERELLELDL